MGAILAASSCRWGLGRTPGPQFSLWNGASASFRNLLKVCRNCIFYKAKFWIRSVCFGVLPNTAVLLREVCPRKGWGPGMGVIVNHEGDVNYLEFFNFSVIPLSIASVWLLYSCSSFILPNLNFNCVILVLPKMTNSIEWGKSGELEQQPAPF